MRNGLPTIEVGQDQLVVDFLEFFIVFFNWKAIVLGHLKDLTLN